MIKTFSGAPSGAFRKAAAATLTAGLLCGLVSACQTRTTQAVDWPDYLGDAASSQFSDLDQINTRNVGQLAVAWTYDFPGNGQSIGNPIVIGSRLYTVWSGGLIALDAATGAEVWRHDRSPILMRGLNIWTSKDGKSQRLFFNSKDQLYAVDAKTGQSIETFGQKGAVDLRVGLDRDPETVMTVGAQAPGRVFGNLLILGTANESAPGYIRAYDVISGRLVWTFHTIPHEGEPNAEDWPKDAWKTQGGVNSWAGMTLDEKSGVLFVPLVGAKPNYYGVDRPGNNLYANSLVALDAKTGKRLWHFQTLHHDIWDSDLPQAPKLLELKRDGKTVEAVLVASKSGFIFVFDRKTGEPVFPIEERPVPQSDVPGEMTSPTQPFPVAPPPFGRQTFTLDDLDPTLEPGELARLRASLGGLRNDGLYTPPSFRGSIALPGPWGSTNMDHGVVDAKRGLYYVVSADIPGILRLEPAGTPHVLIVRPGEDPGAAVYAANCAACHGVTRKGQPPIMPSLEGIAERRTLEHVTDTIVRGRATMPPIALSVEDRRHLLSFLGFQNLPEVAPSPSYEPKRDAAAPQARKGYQSSSNFIFSSRGVPAIRGPWTSLSAYDLNQGTLLWKAPYGSLKGMTDSGQIFPRGAIVGTAGGLLFAGSQDRILRAWDTQTGKVLWQTPIPSMPGGVPAVYQQAGRQFIAVPAAAHVSDTPLGSGGGLADGGRNSLVAYALPVASRDRARQLKEPK